MKINFRNKVICFIMAGAMALCAITACGDKDKEDNTSSAAWTPHKVGLEDTAVNGVKLGMTTDEVKNILGEPDKEENITEDQFIFGTHLDLTYGEMHLSFYDINEGDNIVLGSISADSPEVEFAGGLHTDSTKDEVLDAFFKDANATDLVLYGEKFGSFIYGDYTDNDFIEKKPKDSIQFAYVQDRDAADDGYYMIIYNYYNPLKWSKDGKSYTGDFYHMIFYVDTESDKVKSILLEHLPVM